MGTRLGIDVGKARIGVAKCDPQAMLATPLETVTRDLAGDTDIERIVGLAHEWQAIEIIVGLPLSLSGARTPSTEDAQEFAELIAKHFSEVRLVDERLSTVSAQAQLHSAGRNTKRSRSVIDQAAAVVILQHAIDSERMIGKPSGLIVGPISHD